MILIHADELQVGDVIDEHGQPRRIARVGWEPGWSWPIAADAAGWAMALSRRLIAVQRDA